MSSPTPPPMPPLKTSSLKDLKTSDTQVITDEPNLCDWAVNYPELQAACIRNYMCINAGPKIFQYRKFESILQKGPTCGIVALCMLVGASVEDVLYIAQSEKYTINGEMFSCSDMVQLTRKVLSHSNLEHVTVTLQRGGLASNEIVDKLLNKCLLLVPYDSDFNHEPCLKKGHKAHWVLVCGILITDTVFVLCKHGKTRRLAMWPLHLLAKSNENLHEFAPQREDDGLIYMLPDGGIGGDNGLCDQYVLIEGL